MGSSLNVRRRGLGCLNGGRQAACCGRQGPKVCKACSSRMDIRRDSKLDGGIYLRACAYMSLTPACSWDGQAGACEWPIKECGGCKPGLTASSAWPSSPQAVDQLDSLPPAASERHGICLESSKLRS